MSRIEVEATDAQLGDMCSMVGHEGRVVGVDTVGPAVLVRWNKGAMDVYSVDSPVWSLFALLRDEPVQGRDTCRQCGVSYGGHQHDCPDSDPLVGDTAPVQVVAIHTPGGTIYANPLPGFALPWSNNDGN